MKAEKVDVDPLQTPEGPAPVVAQFPSNSTNSTASEVFSATTRQSSTSSTTSNPTSVKTVPPDIPVRRPLEDDVNDLVSKLPPVILPNMTELEKLQSLADRRAWRDVLALTRSMLQGPNSHWVTIYQDWKQNAGKTTLSLDSQQNDLEVVLQWYVRALISLKHWDELKRELDSWPKGKDYSPKLQIAAAKWKQYLSNDKESVIDELCELRERDPVRVDLALTELFVSLKQWNPAIERLETMLQHIKSVSESAAKHLFTNQQDSTVNFVSKTYETDVYSRQGRIFLQAGALEQADHVFKKAQNIWQDKAYRDFSDHIWYIQCQMQVLLNTSLYELASGQQDQAWQHFYQCSSLFSNKNTSTTLKSYDSAFPWKPASAVSIYGEAVTNMSVCALYSCQLGRAIQLLEDLVRESPTNHLTERVALNLCTMYELEGDGATSTHKKRTLQNIAKRFLLHDIGAECFRFH